MRKHLLKRYIFITAIAAFIAAVMTCVVLTCEAFAADGDASLKERYIWFSYSYTECTGKENTDIDIPVSDDYSTTYPEYYSTYMMLCDTAHKLHVKGEGVAADNVTFTSQNPSVLDIDSTGNVTLYKKGRARIKATVAADETYKECTIYLDVKADRHEGYDENVPFYYEGRMTSWDLDIDTSEGPQQLVIALRPGAGVKYSIDNPNIAQVDQDGIITPLSPGVTQLLLDFDDGGGRYNACRIGRTIKVTGDPVQEYPVDRKVWLTYGCSNCLGETVSLNREQLGYPVSLSVNMMMCDSNHVIHAEGDGVRANNVTFTSMNPEVLGVESDGSVTLIKEGTAEIRVKVAADSAYKAKTVYLAVTVDRHEGWIAADEVHYEGHSPSNGLDLDISGEPQKLSVPLRPGASVSYTSMNPGIVKVDQNGVVTPVSPGETQIRFDVDNGGGIYKAGSFYRKVTVTGEDTQSEEEAAKKAAEEAARKAAEKAAAQKAAAVYLQAQIAKAKALKTPTLKVKARKGRKIKLTWSKVDDADGYIVYIKYPGKKKFVEAVTRDATVKSVTHKGLTKKKVYKYKIRAYKVVNGETYYSPFSKVRKARVK